MCTVAWSRPPEAAVGVGDERVDPFLELLVTELEGDPQRLFGRCDGTRRLPGCPSAVRFDEQALDLRPAGGLGQLLEQAASVVGPSDDDERAGLTEERVADDDVTLERAGAVVGEDLPGPPVVTDGLAVGIGRQRAIARLQAVPRTRGPVLGGQRVMGALGWIGPGRLELRQGPGMPHPPGRSGQLRLDQLGDHIVAHRPEPTGLHEQRLTGQPGGGVTDSQGSKGPASAARSASGAGRSRTAAARSNSVASAPASEARAITSADRSWSPPPRSRSVNRSVCPPVRLQSSNE